MNPQAKSFEFTSYSMNSNHTEAHFSYSIHFYHQESLHFTEKIQFEAAHLQPDIWEEVVDRIMHSMHLILGVTYWKLYCPKEIIISTKPLSKDMADFWDEIYLKGLGEFYYRNKLPLATAPRFPYEDVTYDPFSVEMKDRSLLGIGGGKDAIVAFEMLKKVGEELTGLIINTQKDHLLIDTVVEVMSLSAVKVRRVIDPLLFQQNKLEYTYNGHVPISAIYAFIGFLTAYLYNYTYLIVGNEQSANSENVVLEGMKINHQWSKSAEFESVFQQYTRSVITPDIAYFSLLRPLYEMKITERFVSHRQYLHVFSGCNRNFKVNEQGNIDKLWCGECAKCAFIFTLLAAFLPKHEVIEIFGKNLYNDDALLDIYRELLGVKGVKPFDCVGTEEECKVAMNRAHKRGEFSGDLVMKMFETEVLTLGEDFEHIEQEVMTVHDSTLIPDKFRSLYTL